MDAFFRNPEGKDISKAGENLQKYYNETEASYSSISSKTLQVSLPQETKNLVESTLRYINEMVGIQKKNEITFNQNLEFINSIDEIIPEFISMKKDYSTEVSKQRSSVGNLDSIIAAANKNRDDLNYLKQQLSNLSVPADALSCYEELKKTFNGYEEYLLNIIYSINNEKLLGNSKTPEKITQLYAEPAAKYQQVNADYDNFLKLYAQLKDLNLQ
jgi:hypothetical protein